MKKHLTIERLEILKKRYFESVHRIENYVLNADEYQLVVLLWQLNNCHFELVPYSDKSFLRYSMDETKESILNTLEYYGKDFLIKFLS